MVMRRLSVGPLLSIALLLGAGPAFGDSAGQLVQVEMSNYDFAPSTLQLRANTPYHLRLTNTSHSGHSFDAPKLFWASKIAANDQYKVVAGEVEVEGGQSVDVTFTPTTPGTYKFHCSHFLHSAFGMHGEAVVN